MKPYYDDGQVTIYHGDGRDVLPILVERPDCVVTDPPYKISQEYSTSADADNLLAVAGIYPMAESLWATIRPGGLAAVFYDTRILPLGLDAFRSAGWKYLRGLTLYRRAGNAHQLHGWMATSDFVLILAKPGAKPEFHGPWEHDTYIKARLDPVGYGHPAQKPLDFVTKIVANVCPPSGLVVDPYMGSGTTLRAAKDLGRKAIGIEIEERYCEIAVKRLAQGVLDLGA